MKTRFVLMVIVVISVVLSCSEISPAPQHVEGIRVTSRQDRWILRTLKVTPRSANLIDLNLVASDDEEFAQFKVALGLTDRHVFARGKVQLELSPDGSILNVIGCFDAQVGEHWRYVPEVQKVPTFRPDKKLTMEILSRLSAKGLL